MSDRIEQARARRAQAIEEIRARTGIDEAMIERLVHRFYDKVCADAASHASMLAYILQHSAPSFATPRTRAQPERERKHANRALKASNGAGSLRKWR